MALASMFWVSVALCGATTASHQSAHLEEQSRRTKAAIKHLFDEWNVQRMQTQGKYRFGDLAIKPLTGNMRRTRDGQPAWGSHHLAQDALKKTRRLVKTGVFDFPIHIPTSVLESSPTELITDIGDELRPRSTSAESLESWHSPRGTTETFLEYLPAQDVEKPMAEHVPADSSSSGLVSEVESMHQQPTPTGIPENLALQAAARRAELEAVEDYEGIAALYSPDSPRGTHPYVHLAKENRISGWQQVRDRIMQGPPKDPVEWTPWSTGQAEGSCVRYGTAIKKIAFIPKTVYLRHTIHADSKGRITGTDLEYKLTEGGEFGH